MALFFFLFFFSGFSEAELTQTMEHVEKLIMTRLHKWVFCHDSCDDEQKDLILQRRIRLVLPHTLFLIPEVSLFSCIVWKGLVFFTGCP